MYTPTFITSDEPCDLKRIVTKTSVSYTRDPSTLRFQITDPFRQTFDVFIFLPYYIMFSTK